MGHHKHLQNLINVIKICSKFIHRNLLGHLLQITGNNFEMLFDGKQAVFIVGCS